MLEVVLFPSCVATMALGVLRSFLVQMVEDRNDLSNAIAINSSMANGARLIGPAIAGLVIGAVGEGWCFLMDGVSYLAVIASLLLMRIRRGQHVQTDAGRVGLRDLADHAERRIDGLNAFRS